MNPDTDKYGCEYPSLNTPCQNPPTDSLELAELEPLLREHVGAAHWLTYRCPNATFFELVEPPPNPDISIDGGSIHHSQANSQPEPLGQMDAVASLRLRMIRIQAEHPDRLEGYQSQPKPLGNVDTPVPVVVLPDCNVR